MNVDPPADPLGAVLGPELEVQQYERRDYLARHPETAGLDVDLLLAYAKARRARLDLTDAEFAELAHQVMDREYGRPRLVAEILTSVAAFRPPPSAPTVAEPSSAMHLADDGIAPEGVHGQQPVTPARGRAKAGRRKLEESQARRMILEAKRSLANDDRESRPSQEEIAEAIPRDPTTLRRWLRKWPDLRRDL